MTKNCPRNFPETAAADSRVCVARDLYNERNQGSGASLPFCGLRQETELSMLSPSSTWTAAEGPKKDVYNIGNFPISTNTSIWFWFYRAFSFT